MQVVYQMGSVDGVNFKLKFLDYPYISATVHFEENENSIDKAIQAVSRQWPNEYNQTGNIIIHTEKLDYWLNKSRADQLVDGIRIIDVPVNPKFNLTKKG